MRAQVTLTPAESKKLISKAVANMDKVRKASAEGLVVIHPSSSTYFIVEELTGQLPRTAVWVCGVIVPKGACLSRGASRLDLNKVQSSQPRLEGYSHSWVIQKGILSKGVSLEELFKKMGPEDVYIKGVNALDPLRTVGILIGNRVEGGTIGRVISASRQKGFRIIFPVGLEKLIPVNIEAAAKEAVKTKYSYSMGVNCGLLPCKEGIVITEMEAIHILSGASAIPIAAGGLDGAEGAVTLIIKGEKAEVTKAIKYVEQSKGARLPRANSPQCENCNSAICDFPLKEKPWVKQYAE
jgi:hypothetical protein